jgi:hypothetical protein
MAALAEAGRLDPKRWEAPALLAGLTGDGSNYDVAAKFLEIAAPNASDEAVHSALERALRAARRELSYAAARASAEAASDRGDHKKAAELYEAAWTAIPARAANGMDAAADWLVEDDTAHAPAALLPLKQSGDSSLAGLAAKMLDEMKAVEPAAAQPAPETAAFFGDPGSAEPPRSQELLPRVDARAMEILARPLPRMVEDADPVVLLAALAADRADGSPLVPLPQLPQPEISSDHPWSELQTPRVASVAPSIAERPRQSAELAGNSRNRRLLLAVGTQPAGASVFVEGSAEPLCQTPCDIQAAAGSYDLRLARALKISSPACV